MEIQDRIKALVETLARNPNDFSVKIDTPNSQIYNIIRGKRNKPSFDLIVKICRTFPEISLDWLILGEGAMFRSLPSPGNAASQMEEPQISYGSSNKKRSAEEYHEGLDELKEEVERLKQSHNDLYEKYDTIRDKYIHLLEQNSANISSE